MASPTTTLRKVTQEQYEQALAALSDKSTTLKADQKEEHKKTIEAFVAQRGAPNPEQAQRIDELSRQLREAENRLSSREEVEGAMGPNAEKLKKAEGEIEELKRTIQRLQAQLKEKPKETETSALEAQLTGLTERLEQATKRHEEEIAQLKEQQQREVQDLTGQLEAAQAGQRGEAAKTQAVQAQLALVVAIGTMSLEAVETRLGKLDAPKDDLETFEKGRLTERKETILRDLKSGTERMKAEAAAEQQKVIHARVNQQSKEDRGLFALALHEIPGRIKSVRQEQAKAVEEIRKIDAGEVQDTNGIDRVAWEQARVNAEHKIAMLQALEAFHQAPLELARGALQPQIDVLAVEVPREQQVLRELENPKAGLEKDEPAIAAQKEKVERMDAELKRLEQHLKGLGEIQPSDMLAKAAHIDKLIGLLPADLPADQRKAYIENAVKAIVAMEALLKGKYGEDPTHKNIEEQLKNIFQWHQNSLHFLRDAIEAAKPVKGDNLNEQIKNLKARIELLKRWASDSYNVFMMFGGVGDETAAGIAGLWKDEVGLVLWLMESATPRKVAVALPQRREELAAAEEALLTAQPQEREQLQLTVDRLKARVLLLGSIHNPGDLTEGEAVLAAQRQIERVSRDELVALPKVAGSDTEDTRRQKENAIKVAERKVSLAEERVSLLASIVANYQAVMTSHGEERRQLEWEKSVLGTVHRLFSGLIELIFGFPRFIFDSIRGAGSILVARKD